MGSARAPVDVVPVANQRENKQQEGDQQQACGFERVNVVLGAAALMLLMRGGHGHIVAPWQAATPNSQGTSGRRFRDDPERQFVASQSGFG
jgi:hypothetical protein